MRAPLPTSTLTTRIFTYVFGEHEIAHELRQYCGTLEPLEELSRRFAALPTLSPAPSRQGKGVYPKEPSVCGGAHACGAASVCGGGEQLASP